MSFKIVDENGELPNTSLVLRPEEIRLAVIVAGEILNRLEMKDNKIPTYSFRINITDFGFKTDFASNLIKEICNKELPPNMYLYEIDGKSIFELRGPSGGVTTNLIFYIARKRNYEKIHY